MYKSLPSALEIGDDVPFHISLEFTKLASAIAQTVHTPAEDMETSFAPLLLTG